MKGLQLVLFPSIGYRAHLRLTVNFAGSFLYRMFILSILREHEYWSLNFPAKGWCPTEMLQKRKWIQLASANLIVSEILQSGDKWTSLSAFSATDRQISTLQETFPCSSALKREEHWIEKDSDSDPFLTPQLCQRETTTPFMVFLPVSS